MASGLDPLAGALISAVSGLGGILLGGVVTVYGQRADERRRSRAAHEGGLAVLAVEARDALALVYSIRDKDAWPIACRRTWTETWLAVRSAILARPTDAAVLKPVATAFTSLDELQNAVNTFRDDRQLKPTDRYFLVEKQIALTAAMTALKTALPATDLPEKPARLSREAPADVLKAYEKELDAAPRQPEGEQ